ncbi:MAG: PilT/PilU family type 4a pilus ATPase [Gammaproteobacteria bacterium]|nr:PilT/PilU family type 4a pilus ATPase [Gammaproteobacteria bacterium]MCP5423842.1 PilT/PilU family type 4a pilus ATPase [Gammaproteobacteria bacterium]
MDTDRATGYMFELIQLMLSKKGFEIFITAGSPPAIKVGEEIQRVGENRLTPSQTEILAQSIMNDRQQKEFDTRKESNFTLNYPDIARLRVSVFRQRGSVGMVLRLINPYIPSFEELGLPPILQHLSMAKRGLIVFIGGTGCGKSTSIASMVDYRNEHSQEHIVTIEEPIEYYFRHKNCLVDQREIGVDAESYDVALKYTMRQSPNVIVIGEVHDRESMKYALMFAETGHLCLTTLHANSTDQAFERIINMFPDDRREQLFMDLSLNMLAFVAQRLVKRNDQNGLVPAVEVLLRTPRITDLILKGQIADIKDAMSRSGETGMKTFDQALFDLYEEGKISYDSAIRHADSANTVRLKIKLGSKRPLPASLQGSGDDLQMETRPDDDHSTQWM